ncbi:MAG: putative tRNA-dihydrouridine synthase [Anaerolineae bacterium]|nr:putative tRNA-dihydrouridine synthase [Anaerolineae bacterium]
MLINPPGVDTFKPRTLRPTRPTFYVREVPVYGDALLAPMDGYSDLPYRLICYELGSAMSYTEFTNADGILQKRWSDSIAQKLKFDAAEKPMTIQIYGHDVERLVEAAQRVEQLNPDIIDLNMGCYVKDIAERGAGSGMLRFPERIAQYFARVTRVLRVPATGKIRLGWDDTLYNYLTVAKILEDNGASLIAVHARTKAQAYHGHANWDAIAEIKQTVKIPVIGNGDVKTVADIARMKEYTGCDAVMIGRGAIGNPWIFSGRDRDQVALAERVALLRRHLALNLEFYGQRGGLILFRKHAARYIAGLYGAAHLRVPLLTAESVQEFDDLLGQYQTDAHEFVQREHTALGLAV